MPMVKINVCAGPELSTSTLYELLTLRAAIFVVEQNCVYLDPDGRDLAIGTQHLWIDGDSVPIASAVRILDGADGADGVRIGRVVTHIDHRGEGLAAALMTRARELIGDRPSRLEAQAHLQAWYEQFGYTVTGPEYLEDGIPHVPMTSAPRKTTRTGLTCG